VLADPNQMEQVIINLVVNAKDAMPRGGTLTLETWNQGPQVAFSVSDTGQGMTEDVLARIYEPFITTKEAGKGTGLGLSLALGIVEQSGGTLDATSKPGCGTTFSVALPGRRRARNGVPRSPRRSPGPEPGPCWWWRTMRACGTSRCTISPRRATRSWKPGTASPPWPCSSPGRSRCTCC